MKSLIPRHRAATPTRVKPAAPTRRRPVFSFAPLRVHSRFACLSPAWLSVPRKTALPGRPAFAFLSAMHKGRLEAFSDGVLAIIITIMVLEMKVPHGTHLAALRPVLPIFFCYALSFLNVALYWNNHHHLFQAVQRVDGRVLWANLHLLFWLSLFPFVTGWMAENHFASLTVSAYGAVLILAALAYYLLVRALLACHPSDSKLAHAIGRDFKGKISLGIYAAAVVIACAVPWLAVTLYATVALLWLIPDRRIEHVLVE
jgi:uncharacterized membrane protein